MIQTIQVVVLISNNKTTREKEKGLCEMVVWDPWKGRTVSGGEESVPQSVCDVWSI